MTLLIACILLQMNNASLWSYLITFGIWLLHLGYHSARSR